jgi:diacylglycerol kinase family enzyme
LAASRSSPLVAVVGGDGTIRGPRRPWLAAASRRRSSRRTGNVFAAALIPRRIAAVRLIEAGQPSPVDGIATWGQMLTAGPAGSSASWLPADSASTRG